MVDVVAEAKKGTDATAAEIGKVTDVTGISLSPIFLQVAAVGAIIFVGAIVAGFIEGASKKV